MIYATGFHVVTRLNYTRKRHGVPHSFKVYFPDSEGIFPVLYLLHQSCGSETWYDTVLEQVATHGFIAVVADVYDDRYVPGVFSPLREANRNIAFIKWMKLRLESLIQAVPDFTHIGLLGYGRSNIVSWTMVHKRPDLFKAVAGIDPAQQLEHTEKHQFSYTPIRKYRGTSLTITTEDDDAASYLPYKVIETSRHFFRCVRPPEQRSDSGLPSSCCGIYSESVQHLIINMLSVFFTAACKSAPEQYRYLAAERVFPGNGFDERSREYV